MTKVLIIGLGGMMGTMGRWLAGEALRQFAPSLIYPATFFVNIVGCFFIGLVAFSIPEEKPLLRLFLMVGFLGGFTTYSAFGLEIHDLLATGRRLQAVLYPVTTIVCGVFAVWGGAQIGERL